jgi:TolB protein
MVRAALGATLLVALSAMSAAAQNFLYVTGASGNPEIMLKKPDVDPAALAGDAATDTFPYWSRKGDYIAFASNRADRRFQIFRMDADGGNVLQLSLEPRGESLSPSWSPDGTRVVFQNGLHHHWDLVVVNSDGEAWRRIVYNGWQPDWSPLREKGDQIAFVSARHDAGLGIYLCNPDGTNIRRIQKLTNTIGHVHPIWSPNAKLIAYTDRVGKSHEIFVLGPDGENMRQLTAIGSNNIYPNWSTDGKKVYFLHELEPQKWQWMMVDVDTRKVDNFELLPPLGYVRGMRMHWHE